MKSVLLIALEKYLKREGLSTFLVASKTTTPFSITFILLVCLAVALITKLFGKSFWFGFFIPIILLFIFSFVIIVYILFREFPKMIQSRGKYDSKSSLLYLSSSTLGAGIMVLFMIVTPIVVGVYLSSWITALISFVALLIVLAFSMAFLLNRDYVILAILEIAVQALKGWALSWQTVLATMPLLLVAILLSLFSGDLWGLLGKLTISELTILIIFMYIPVFFAVMTKIDLTDLISHRSLLNEGNVVDRVFSIRLILRLKNKDILSIEDRDDAVSILKSRSLERSKELIASRLETRIRWWFLLVIILTCILLGLSFFIIFVALFSLISPSLAQMGWLSPSIQSSLVRNPIPQVSYFLASIQVAAFAASLLDKPKDNILFRRTLEKAVDWMAAIIVFQAIYLPILQIWESREEAPWHKKFGVTALRAKVIASPTATDDEVKKACETLEEFFPRVQLVDFSVFRQADGLAQKMRFGIEDFQWKYLNNRKLGKKLFNPIPYDSEIQEQHMLGREKLLAGEQVPNEWFGNNEGNSSTGRTIWEFDENHEVIMHPFVIGDDDKVLHIYVNLFRKFSSSSDYSNLAHKLLDIIRQKNPKAKMIVINFHFRSSLDSKIIADLQWTSDGSVFYKDELQKKGNFLTPIFSLYFKLRKRTRDSKKE